MDDLNCASSTSSRTHRRYIPISVILLVNIGQPKPQTGRSLHASPFHLGRTGHALAADCRQARDRPSGLSVGANDLSSAAVVSTDLPLSLSKWQGVRLLIPMTLVARCPTAPKYASSIEEASNRNVGFGKDRDAYMRFRSTYLLHQRNYQKRVT